MSGRDIRRALEAHPREVAIGAWALLALAALAAAYLAIFTQFAAYDDEGTILVSIKAFAHGDVLYRDVYSPYGPFFYELFGGFFALTGLAVSTDAGRLIVIVVWVASSLLFGLSVRRLSASLLFGLTAAMVVFSVLDVLVNEPMHPQGLGVMLLGAITLIVASGPPRRARAVGAGAGVVLGALLLTKINLGGLALAALALAAVLAIEPLHRLRPIRWPVVVAFLAMPTILLGRELDADWTRNLIALELLGGLALLVTVRSSNGPRWAAGEGSTAWLLGAIAGFAAFCAMALAALFLTGVTPAELYDGAVKEAIKIGDVYRRPLDAPGAALAWGAAAMVAALLAARLRGRGGIVPSTPWPGLLRLAAGLAIWLSVARLLPSFLGLGDNPLALPLVLSWVAAATPPDAGEPPYRRFVRAFLPALALAEALQVYPVASSQVGIASATFVAVGGLCLADGLRCMRAWGSAQEPRASERLGIALTLGLVALAGAFAVHSLVRPGHRNLVAYSQQKSLSLPGASLLHIPKAQAVEYEKLVGLIRRYHCTALIGYPNYNSIYLWSGIEPPRPSIPGAWVVVVGAAEQQRVVDQLRRSPTPCVIRNESGANAWLMGAPRPHTPLVRYVFDSFLPVEGVGLFEFMTPASARR